MHWRSKRINALEQGLALWRPAATMFRSFARSFMVILRYGFRSTGAAFTYSLELDVIKIQAFNAGTKRVADDIKNVLRKIESWHQGPIIGYRIMYLESNGLWTGVDWDGKSVGFFALGETEESAAAKKLIAIRPRMLGE